MFLHWLLKILEQRYHTTKNLRNLDEITLGPYFSNVNIKSNLQKNICYLTTNLLIFIVLPLYVLK